MKWWLVPLTALVGCGAGNDDAHRSSLSTDGRSLNERAFLETPTGLKIHSAGCFALPAVGEVLEPSAGGNVEARPDLGDLQHHMRIGRNGIDLTVLVGGIPALRRFYDESFIANGDLDEFVMESAGKRYRHVYWGAKCSESFDYPVR